MSEHPFISSALGSRPTVPYPNAATEYIIVINESKRVIFIGILNQLINQVLKIIKPQ